MNLSQRISFCGVLCALSCVALISTVFPYATYALAALAGMVFTAATLELGTRYGILCYMVTAIISLLITPDIEAKILFLTFLGYYPVIKLRLDLLENRLLSWGIKLIVFNISIIASFCVLTYVIGVDETEFMIGGVYLPWLFLVLGNIVFVIYDVALSRVNAFYRVRIHPLVKKMFHS